MYAARLSGLVSIPSNISGKANRKAVRALKPFDPSPHA
jgi:hypothetical protein